MEPLADRIEAGRFNTCCLVEANLFTAEHVPGHRIVRKCRICGSRHMRMRAEIAGLFASMGLGINTVRRRAGGARQIGMHAEPGRFAE